MSCPARFALVLAASLAVPACSGNGGVTGMTFTVTERMTGEGPLGTCSFETNNDPLVEPDAESLAWSVGAELGIVGGFIQACGTALCQPISSDRYEWFLLGKPAWTFERTTTDDLNGLSGELAGVMKTSAAREGGLGVHFGDTTYGPIALESFKPDHLKITAFETWSAGQSGPAESVVANTVKAGSTMNVLLRAFDKADGRLCGRGPVDTTGTTGLTIAVDPAMGAKTPKANSVLVLTFGSAGTATLKLSFGGASLTQDFDVRP
ncbi:MAG: hypothetical protein QM765_07415 [Myxococcales bacterium]